MFKIDLPKKKAWTPPLKLVTFLVFFLQFHYLTTVVTTSVTGFGNDLPIVDEVAAFLY